MIPSLQPAAAADSASFILSGALFTCFLPIILKMIEQMNGRTSVSVLKSK